jgi:hypothetical protein
MKELILIPFITIYLLINYGCDSSLKPARGPEDEIFVFADSAEYEKLKSDIEDTFEKEIFTPQPEKLFLIKRINANEIENYKSKKSLIIVAPLNSGSATSKLINKIIDSEVQVQLISDPDFVIKKYDLWAKGQLVTVLTGASIQEIEFKILRNRDNLLFSYQKKSDQRLFESLYDDKYEKKNIEGKFLEDYGWIIYVQSDYELAANHKEQNFVCLKSSTGGDLERWIFVHWIENASPEYLNVDSIKVIRNRMTKTFYHLKNDSSYTLITDDYFSSSEVNFNSRYAIVTQGLWDLNTKGMNGPFINYTFYDEKTKRIYMLDGSVFAPKYYKRIIIQQIDVMLQSFLTDDELSKERKEDLLEQAN